MGSTILPSVFNLLYPVGSVYQTLDADFNPMIAWGGVWELLPPGLTLRQASSGHPTGTQFGSATHTLTMAELPEAKLNIEMFNGTQLALNGAGAPTNGKLISNNTSSVWANEIVALLPGGNKAHNNIGPSLAVNIWKRTA